MQIKQLKGTQLYVSDLCLGTGNFGAAVNEEQAFALLDEYVEAGGNFLDTAAVYCSWVTGDNSSEQFIGKWLKSRNAYKEIVIATKGGHYDLKDGKKTSRVTFKDLESDLDQSLKTLGIEQIPMYYLHRDNTEKSVEEIIDICESFVKKGKIQYYAFSNWTKERYMESITIALQKGIVGPIALSNQYSLAVPNREMKPMDETTVRMEREDIKWVKDSNTTLIPYTSIAGGIFERIHRDSSSLNKAQEEVYLTKENLDIYENMRKLNERYGYSMLAISLAFLYAQDCATIPLFASRTKEQLLGVIEAAKVRLSEEDMRLFSVD
ncbi:aldo/keto reductase [Lachnospiraceae bacterium OttesenSCG-928-D06]|nr:aldo/keto reductase [Lachnospiraceae bacterium OttesenSCG-928-D06]